MNCKFCQSLLEEESSVCPVCGKDNDAEEIETVEEPVEALLDENAVTKDTVELPVEEIQEALQEETPKKKNRRRGRRGGGCGGDCRRMRFVCADLENAARHGQRGYLSARFLHPGN